MADRQIPTVRVSVALVMLFQVAALFIQSFVKQRMSDRAIDPTSAQHLSTLVGFFVLAILMWPILRDNRSSIIALFQRPRSWARLIVFSVAVGMALRAMNWAWIISSIALGFRGPGDPLHAAGPMFWWACPAPAILTLSIFVMALLTPIIEEVISRGLILFSLIDRNRLLAIPVSSILFAVLHRIDSIPLAFVFGIVAAIQMLNYQTLWGTVIAHATFNFSAIIDWECLHGIWIPASTSTRLGMGALLMAATLLLVATWLARQTGAGAGQAPRHQGRPC